MHFCFVLMGFELNRIILNRIEFIFNWDEFLFWLRYFFSLLFSVENYSTPIKYCHQERKKCRRIECNVDDTEPKTICSLIRWSNWLFDLIKLIKYANFSFYWTIPSLLFFNSMHTSTHKRINCFLLTNCNRNVGKAVHMLCVTTIRKWKKIEFEIRVTRNCVWRCNSLVFIK